MGSFDIRPDAPGMLRSEALNMTIKFDRTGPTTGRISWNIPTPSAGCTSENQAYNGIVVTLDTTPTALDKSPTAGVAYASDSTGDANLFAGDKLGTALIVGAFYDDRTTTFFDVTGLKANTPYYISGFPVDAQLRYFVEGIHAYSVDVSNRGTDSTHGSQVVVLNPEQATMGIQPTDSTGLAATSYDFSIQVGIVPKPRSPIDSVDCTPAPAKYTITVDGTLSQTYAELTAQINKQFALLSNAQQGATPPNTGAFYWNASQQKLYTWNGAQHVEVLNVVVQLTAPNSVVVGTYWYNPAMAQLQIWTGATWTSTTVVNFSSDPTLPIADETYWFDGTSGYLWNGVTWCHVLTLHSSVDPSLPLVPPAGSYWHDTANGILYRWNVATGMWNETSVVQYPSDPNSLPVGAYWFNETTSTLLTYNTPSSGWNPVNNVAVSESEPTTPAPGKFWYNPATLELFQRNPSNTAWVELDVVAFPVDPTTRNYCDLWWNTSTDVLSVWDSLSLSWKVATQVYQQSTDPTNPPMLEQGTLWFDTSDNSLNVWVNACFKLVTPILWPTDPTSTISVGTVWFNTATSLWYVRTGGNTWATITPTQSASDPTSLAAGTFWFNTSSSTLQQWNGITWVTILYSTTPLTPARGTLWFNTGTNTLMQWNGTTWVAATPIATVEIDCNGNLLFTDMTTGSLSFIGITDGTLFASLANKFAIHSAKPGVDGASSQPSYEEIGIGSDGSLEERLRLQTEIRYELGYPVVDVELTPDQLDYAITKALNELRARSGLAYKRGFFFMSINPETQVFYLTNKIQGMDHIVDVVGVYRLTSSFLASAHGAGVYGQIVLQHMYNMGTFDLLSYHIMAEYTKLMEQLFAARITFTWNEQKRELFVHHRFPFSERMVCIEATVERTEQDIIADRYARPWIRKYACGAARMMLAEQRGKFTQLPGAGGGITLNAMDLRQQGQKDMEECINDIESFIFDKPEEYGMGTTFLFG